MKDTTEKIFPAKGIPRPGLDIIIVNWNSGDQLRECLGSIASMDLDGFELDRVVIIDNASTDDSAENIPDMGLPLQLDINKENTGFAATCNMGARESVSDYLLFLNPDTRLFKYSLSIPIKFMEEAGNADVGIVGIQLVDEKGVVSRTCTRFPTPAHFFSKMLGLSRALPGLFPSHLMVDWDHGSSRKVDHVMGAFFLIRRDLFIMSDGFDERFFVYLEDLDLSLRIRNSGFTTYYLAEAQAFHKGGGTSEQIRAKRLFYSLRSRIFYGYKHFNPMAATGLMLGTVFLEPVSRLLWAMIRFKPYEIKETMQGYFLLWRSIPEILEQNRKGRKNEDPSA